MRHSRTTSLALESRRSRPGAERQTQTPTRWIEAPQRGRVPDACRTESTCKRTRFQAADQSMAVASRVGRGRQHFPRFARKLEKTPDETPFSAFGAHRCITGRRERTSDPHQSKCVEGETSRKKAMDTKEGMGMERGPPPLTGETARCRLGGGSLTTLSEPPLTT